MLKYRALTWALLIVFVIWGIYSLPLMGFSVIMTLFWSAAAWEWVCLLKIDDYWQRFLLLSVILALSVGAYFYFPRIALWGGVLAWFAALYLIIQFPNVITLSKQTFLVKLSFCILQFVPCWVGLNVIRAYDLGLIYILFMLSLIWMMDTLGYLVGKPWGRHKLIPQLSPGKSIEGVLGGIVFTLVFSGMVVYASGSPFKQSGWTLALILLVACFSVVGDLYESLLKRQVGVKDSGRLLPGHGGMLDRMDSTFSAVPLFALILPWIHA